jgi:dTDP-4-amino-4,6-dideoxygalactose transaminase
MTIQLTRPILPPLEEIMAELSPSWESGRISNFGPKHFELEEKLKDRLGVEYVSLFNNGTTALISAIQALRLSGEVIVSPFTFPATIHALEWNGITPVFCDIKESNMTIDPLKIPELITSKTTGIIGVHVFGNTCDHIEIDKIAREYGLKVIYDAAHAFDRKGIGNVGDVSMFSFHPTKLFHTGEGGALTFKDPDLYKRLYYSKNFGIKSETEIVSAGINGKMSEIQAALGLVILRYVDEEINNRKKISFIYDEFFMKNSDNFLISFARSAGMQYYLIKCYDDGKFSRDSIYNRLRQHDIFSRKYFYPLCSDLACYRNSPRGDLSVSEDTSKQVLCLPFYGDLKKMEVEQICDILLNA